MMVIRIHRLRQYKNLVTIMIDERTIEHIMSFKSQVDHMSTTNTETDFF